MKKIQSYILGEIISSNSPEAYSLNKKSNFGEKIEDKIHFSFSETIFLVEKGKMEIYSKNKKIQKKELIDKLKRIDKKIQIKYPVFKNLREKGYVVKTALKFGADFRVYDKDVQPGEDHAKWIVFPVHESKTLTWHDFSAKNRVSHSTRKNLLIGVVDDEDDVTYYEIAWKKP